VVFASVAEADYRVRHAGLVPQYLTSGDWVRSQTPAPGTVVPVGSKVKMTLQRGPVP
jgi:beta-lactam-binding protein with PASTA domain